MEEPTIEGVIVTLVTTAATGFVRDLLMMPVMMLIIKKLMIILMKMFLLILLTLLVGFSVKL